jgi:hypothetical protein
MLCVSGVRESNVPFETEGDEASELVGNEKEEVMRNQIKFVATTIVLVIGEQHKGHPRPKRFR